MTPKARWSNNLRQVSSNSQQRKPASGESRGGSGSHRSSAGGSGNQGVQSVHVEREVQSTKKSSKKQSGSNTGVSRQQGAAATQGGDHREGRGSSQVGSEAVQRGNNSLVATSEHSTARLETSGGGGGDHKQSASDVSASAGNVAVAEHRKSLHKAGDATGVQDRVQGGGHLPSGASQSASGGSGKQAPHLLGDHKESSHSAGAGRSSATGRQSGVAAGTAGGPASSGTNVSGKNRRGSTKSGSVEGVCPPLAGDEQDGEDSASLFEAQLQEGSSSRTVGPRGQGRHYSGKSYVRAEAQKHRSGAGLRPEPVTHGAGDAVEERAGSAAAVEQEAAKASKLAEMSEELHAKTNNVLGYRNRRSKLPTAFQLKMLKLHAKPVTPLNMDFIYNHVLSPSMAEYVRFLLGKLSFNKAAPGVDPGRAFRVPEAHADKMASIGVFECLGKLSDIDLSNYNVVRYFCVVESRESGDRLRPICWPASLLAISDYVSKHKLKSVDQYRKLALLTGQAATFDLAASFWQVPLPQDSKLVCVSEDGRVLRMTRMPYGADMASEVMHIIVSALAGDPAYARPSPKLNYIGKFFQRDVAVHIDNVLFAGEHAALRSEEFKRLCKLANAQLNVEEGNALADNQKFVGMQFDFKSHTVRLKDGYGADIRAEAIRTHEDLERVMGKLLYAGAVLAVNWRDFLLLIKQYRRVLSFCGKHPEAWTRPLHLWDCVRPQIHALIDLVRSNKPVQVHPDVITADEGSPDAIVATDATPVSFGGLLLRRGFMPLAFGALFPTRLEINHAETAAVLCVMERFRDELSQLSHGGSAAKVLLLIDNTSALHRISAGDSTGRVAEDGIARQIVELAREVNVMIRVQYISTKVNPADRVSRMAEADPVLVQHVVERAWGRHALREQRRACGSAARVSVR